MNHLLLAASSQLPTVFQFQILCVLLLAFRLAFPFNRTHAPNQIISSRHRLHAPEPDSECQAPLLPCPSYIRGNVVFASGMCESCFAKKSLFHNIPAKGFNRTIINGSVPFVQYTSITRVLFVAFCAHPQGFAWSSRRFQAPHPNVFSWATTGGKHRVLKISRSNHSTVPDHTMYSS